MFPDLDEIDLDIDADVPVGSSGEAFSARPPRAPIEPAIIDEADESRSPVFKLLSRPELPELENDTRARLMMQSPTRLYLYWSVGKHSYQALKKVVGTAFDDYRLIVRLLDLTDETEELHAIDAEGSWWFNVQPDTGYRAEIGFYSSSRPFVRILFSNSITTPRKGPSPHSSAEARWAVTTREFAEVLDVSGFEEDAFDVIGETANIAHRFARQIGLADQDAAGLDESEIVQALGHLSEGLPIDDLKYRISPELFALLHVNQARLSPEEISEFEGFESYSAVGGSLVNIPRRRRRHLSSIDIP